jgi:hypothetical protein
MDLRAYYQKIRSLEAEMLDAYPIVVSKETADGGRSGKYSEVTRAVAAKLIVEGMARLATPEETKAYRDAQAEAKRIADQAAEAAKVQFTVISTSEMARLTTPKRDKA